MWVYSIYHWRVHPEFTKLSKHLYFSLVFFKILHQAWLIFLLPKHVYLSLLFVAWSSSPSTISCPYYSPYPRAHIKLFTFIWYAWHYWNLKLLFKWQCWSSKPFHLLEGSTHWYVKPMHKHWVVLICFK